MQLVCGLGDLATLVAGALQLICSGLTRAVAARNRRGAIGRAARNLVERHLPGMAVVEAYDHHAEVQEIRDDREQRRLLASVLGGRRRECAPDLAVERTAHPQPAGLIEEIGHLRRQAAEPGTSADDDGVVVGEILDLRDRGGLIELVVGLAGDLLGDELGHPLDVHVGAGLARPLGGRVRHRLDMAVGRVVENQNLRHDLLLDDLVLGAADPLRRVDHDDL